MGDVPVPRSSGLEVIAYWDRTLRRWVFAALDFVLDNHTDCASVVSAVDLNDAARADDVLLVAIEELKLDAATFAIVHESRGAFVWREYTPPVDVEIEIGGE